VGDALIDAGVDIVSTANNHSLDKGEKGLKASLDYLDQIGLPHVGTSRSANERQTLKIMNINGIKAAYLSYTYGTNGIPVPEGKDYLVNLIDKPFMQEEIHRAKNEADIVVMSLHWGNEYQLQPTDEQKELAKYLVDEGVDIIFGHHPHVLQPMEWIEAKDGRKSLVVYSLGNFLSGQMRDYKDIGGLATVHITKYIDQKGVKIKLSNPSFFPTYVSNKQQKNYRIVPLKEAGSYGMKNAESKYNEIQEHMLGKLD
jgi:poly-gamma-glutamate synthesis protein (capsule biosynthesis protein)